MGRGDSEEEVDLAVETFKKAWHDADALGMEGGRVRYALDRLIDMGWQSPRPIVETDEAPKEGHTFRISVSSRGTYSTPEAPFFIEAGYWEETPNVLEVRAWNLQEALNKAARITSTDFGKWFE